MRGERASLKTSDAPRGLALPEIAQEGGSREGYLWGRKDVAIPIGAVTGSTMESASNITKHG